MGKWEVELSNTKKKKEASDLKICRNDVSEKSHCAITLWDFITKQFRMLW